MPDPVVPAAKAPVAESDFAPRARRSAFKVTDQGALYLEFDRHHVLAVRPSPPRVWRRPVDGSGPWKGQSDLPFELNVALREVATAGALAAGELKLESVPLWERPPTRTSARIRRANLERFFAALDPLARAVVARDWGQGTWPLYCLLASSPEARELCATDDGMRVAWALAQARRLLFPHAPKRALTFARRWAPRKRRDILGRLGFPPTAASVKALAKVPLSHLTVTSACALREVLHDAAASVRAQQVPVLTRGALEVLRDPLLRAHVDHAFLVELADYGIRTWHAAEERILSLLKDSVRLAAQLRRTPRVFSSVKALRNRHDQLAQWASKLAQASSAPLPPLPIALSAHDLRVALPLRSGLELLEEGRQMGHCLGSLEWQQQMAHLGTYVAFAVHHPTRLTLSLVRGDDGMWQLGDLAGPHNAPPPRAVNAWVQDLLERFNGASTSISR